MDGSESAETPDKFEYEIAKFLRSKLPPKQNTLMGHKVDYFIGNNLSLIGEV